VIQHDARTRGSIHLLVVVPLYGEELRIKLRGGTGDLLVRFVELGITDIIDPHRPNAVVDA